MQYNQNKHCLCRRKIRNTIYHVRIILYCCSGQNITHFGSSLGMELLLLECKATVSSTESVLEISKSTPLVLWANWRRTRERTEWKKQVMKERRKRQTTGRRGELLLGDTVGWASRWVDKEQLHCWPSPTRMHTCTRVVSSWALGTLSACSFTLLSSLYITIITSTITTFPPVSRSVQGSCWW